MPPSSLLHCRLLLLLSKVIRPSGMASCKRKERKNGDTSQVTVKSLRQKVQALTLSHLLQEFDTKISLRLIPARSPVQFHNSSTSSSSASSSPSASPPSWGTCSSLWLSLGKIN